MLEPIRTTSIPEAIVQRVIHMIGDETWKAGDQRMGLMAAEDTLRVLRGEKPQHLANPEVWDRRRTTQQGDHQ